MAVDGQPVPLDPLEAVLEVRDQLIGIQAQLDELRARVDAVQHSRRRGWMRGMSSRARSARDSSARRPRPE